MARSHHPPARHQRWLCSPPLTLLLGEGFPRSLLSGGRGGGATLGWGWLWEGKSAVCPKGDPVVENPCSRVAGGPSCVRVASRQMLGAEGCVRRLGTNWMSATPGPAACRGGGEQGRGGGRWEKIPEATQLRADPAFGGGGGEESKGSARSRGARDAYCQECAGGAGSTQLAVARPPLPAACVLSANLQIRIPPPS